MNIFILDKDINNSAKYHVDKHVVKQILESAQLLCTAHHVSGSSAAPYRMTHKNHPCSIWTRKSMSNYLWICDFSLELCKEYTYRYGKIHKTQQVIEWCKNNLPDIEDLGLTPFALAMPDECKKEDAVAAYRDYYIKYKKHLFSWKNREVPLWIK